MRKFCAMISVAMVYLILFACQPAQPQPSIMPIVPTKPVSTLPVAPVPTLIRLVTPAPPVTWPVTQPTPEWPAPLTRGTDPTASISRATQAPIPTPTFTGLVACASHPSQPWRTWSVAQQPSVIYTLIADQGVVWAGTSLGVFRIAPRTGAITQSLVYRVAGEVRKLFPLGEGRLWADGSNGPFYYDGRQWTPLNITGTLGVPSIWAMDLDGNVCVTEYRSRMNIYYSLPGHIPPPAPSAWKATKTDKCGGVYSIWTLDKQRANGFWTHFASVAHYIWEKPLEYRHIWRSE